MKVTSYKKSGKMVEITLQTQRQNTQSLIPYSFLGSRNISHIKCIFFWMSFNKYSIYTKNGK